MAELPNSLADSAQDCGNGRYVFFCSWVRQNCRLENAIYIGKLQGHPPFSGFYTKPKWRNKKNITASLELEGQEMAPLSIWSGLIQRIHDPASPASFGVPHGLDTTICWFQHTSPFHTMSQFRFHLGSSMFISHHIIRYQSSRGFIVL